MSIVLTGLPPKPNDVKDFEIKFSQNSELAYESLVNDLTPLHILASDGHSIGLMQFGGLKRMGQKQIYTGKTHGYTGIM